MKQYKVRTGQNIYDIALTIYGSVDGIFDLLSNNRWLNMDTTLSNGMILNYSENFSINPDIVTWLGENGILVKNGEHTVKPINVLKVLQDHFKSKHPEIIDDLEQITKDEQNIFFEGLCTPKIIIQQQGQLSCIKFQLKSDKHLIIDWGDNSECQLVGSDNEQFAEHYYKGGENHVIVLYGDTEFNMLDFSELNGLYYPLDIIYVDNFITPVKIEKLNKLIVKL